jgi:hypothetical protein
MDYMMLQEQLLKLKGFISELKPAGSDGFEGLIKIALETVTNLPFRLAKSGTQFGIDGASSFSDYPVSFECKRYTKTSLKSDDILAKIKKVAISGNPIDLWILAATCTVSTQDANDTEKAAISDGFHSLILDWDEEFLPSLAVLLAMAKASSIKFINAHLDVKEDELKDIFEEIVNSNYFDSVKNTIKNSLDITTLSFTSALNKNYNWLKKRFSDPEQCKASFQQYITPANRNGGKVLNRSNICSKIEAELIAGNKDNLVVIEGREGNGKSWVIAQAWLTMKEQPICVFLPADHFVNFNTNIQEFIINSLINATDELKTDVLYNRWKRILDGINHSKANRPNILFVIDGINQNPKIEWARIINSLLFEVSKLNGRLMVTSRTEYFEQKVEELISSRVTKIRVPEWTESERNNILESYKYTVSDISLKVLIQLLNPRLLNLALKLLNEKIINSAKSLDVNYLLFEHLRNISKETGVNTTSQEFATQLIAHAVELKDKLLDNDEFDLFIFHEKLDPILSGRFFTPLSDEPGKYELLPECIPLAMGFEIFYSLSKAERRGSCLQEYIKTLIEPVSSLDITTEVLLASLLICNKKVGSKLIFSKLFEAFVLLQNLDVELFNTFESICLTKPEHALNAIEDLFIDNSHHHNNEWIEGVFFKLANDKSCWRSCQDFILKWLSYYCLDPKVSCFNNKPEEIEESRSKLEQKINNLVVYERNILSKSIEIDSEANKLFELSFKALSKKNLTPYIKSLWRWKFTQALNSGHSSLYEQFEHLIKFNSLDWSDSRNVVLVLADEIKSNNCSSTAQWAISHFLNSTGDSSDSVYACLLIDELTQGRDWGGNFRLIERYCETDPCDPLSHKPKNIAETLVRFSELDVAKIRSSAWCSEVDNYFDDTHVGLARFESSMVIRKTRSILSHIYRSREGESLRFGAFIVSSHSSLITEEIANYFIERWIKYQEDDSIFSLSGEEAQYIPQFLMQGVFPILSAEEQAEIFFSNKMDKAVLYKLLDELKPLSNIDALVTLIKTGDDHLIDLVLTYLGHSGSALTHDIINLLIELLNNNTHRKWVFNIAVQHQDKSLLKAIIKLPFNLESEVNKQDYEILNYSLCLLYSVNFNLIGTDEALSKISPKYIGQAIAIFPKGLFKTLIPYVELVFKQAMNCSVSRPKLTMEMDVNEVNINKVALFSLNSIDDCSYSETEKFQRFSDPDSFEKKQKLAQKRFNKFTEKLFSEDSYLVMSQFNIFDFEDFITNTSNAEETFYQLFISAPKSSLPYLANYIMMFIFATRHNSNDKSYKLLHLLKGVTPVISKVFGLSRIQLFQFVLWKADDSDLINKLRFNRLDSTSNDFELSQEVLAALLGGKYHILEDYIHNQLKFVEPLHTAKALMVSGFLNKNELTDKLFEDFSGFKGVIGKAREAAMYAYNRNDWAQYWYFKMVNSETNEEFWVSSRMFLKIVDQRFECWDSCGGTVIFKKYFPMLKEDIKKRVKKWGELRAKAFNGDKVPDEVYLYRN